MPLVLDLFLNANPKIEITRMGREQHPVLVIDNALENPDTLRQWASSLPFVANPATAYPGLNAPAPEAYVHLIAHAVRDLVKNVFGLPDDKDLTYLAFFGLSTQSAQTLKDTQRIPHVDSANPFRIALVHYLCDEAYGGTGFFRQRSTGLESLRPHQIEAFNVIARRELDACAHLAPGYVDADTPNFEMIGHVPLRYNRLIAYRSNVFHAPLLRGPELINDSLNGRLTVNSFVEVKN